MDNEIFELCKEVYELFPDWETKDHMLISNEGYITVWEWRNAREFSDAVPLYTSDYLLEKLPNYLESKYKYFLSVEKFDDGTFSAGYGVVLSQGYVDDPKVGTYGSDTPLKALLKLTLALKEAGEL